MGYSYIAYIDESGDDGLGRFREAGAVGGQSHWLIISACVFRHSLDLQAVRWRDEMLGGKARKKGLHFADLQHGQKIFASQCLARKNLRVINVLSNKTTIAERTYRNKNQLYFYLTRYLIERISWLCRDYRRLVTEGDGRAKIVFSRRGGMSYPDFKDYLLRLQADSSVQIHWPVIDIDGIEALDHSTRAGLQLADAAASAFAAAVEPDRFGNAECRYAEILKPVVYCRGANYFSYGVKTVPRFEDMQLSSDQARFAALFQ
jgi:hypothetical protein